MVYVYIRNGRMRSTVFTAHDTGARGADCHDSGKSPWDPSPILPSHNHDDLM